MSRLVQRLDNAERDKKRQLFMFVERDWRNEPNVQVQKERG